ncbi:hypothetical protein C2S52_014406 [Perilla frutescens var. hirtella]|nr:hypothetical protein C2S52_014406 [Perilla frutescens var. hirtella]
MTENSQKNAFPLTISYQDEAKDVAPCNLQTAFKILSKHGSQMKRMRSGAHGEESQLKHLENEKSNEASSQMGGNSLNSQILSAVSIMRMAEISLSQSISEKEGDLSNPANAFGFDSRVVRRHAEHLKRVLWLLDAAEKYSNQQYDQAEEVLVFALSGYHADHHPILRVVSFYARDLKERISMVKGRINLEMEVELVDSQQGLSDLKAAIHVREQKLPLPQISHFTAVQTIFDSVASAERVHLIDIGVKFGSYWIVMIHALANRKNFRLQQLKITAVCTCKDSNVKETDELDKDCLELEAGETVAVYLEFCLFSLSVRPKKVEALLIRLSSLNPHLMVVVDVEANGSSSAFTVRFKEALFLSSALFDSFEDSLERDNHYSRIAEKLHFQEVICNGVLSDNDEGSFKRHRKIDFWREYFSRFGIVETELSQTSMDQARLMIRDCPSWSSCSIGMNGKTMLIGWNDIPLWFLSAWKFQKRFSCKANENQIQIDLKGVEDSVEATSYYSGLEFFQGLDDFAKPCLFPSKYDLHPNIASSSFQPCGMLSSNEPQDLQPNEENEPYKFPSASMEILRHCTSRAGAVDGERRDMLSNETKGQRAPPSTLSVNHVIELAAGNFIHSNSEIGGNLSAFSHSYGIAFLGLSTDDGKDIQLVQDLLLCAEKVCNQQYSFASKLLDECSKLSLGRTNVIQRLVYYFTEALRDRIQHETERFSGKCIVNKWPQELIPSISATASFIHKLPFNQVTQFAGIQSVVDHVSARRKVHVVDLEIHGGLTQAILMQSLVAGSESPLQHLKITAVATHQSNLHIDEAGILLKNLAKSLNLSFSFHVISLDDILDLHHNLDRGETVVVQAAHALRFMIPKPSQLEKLMRVIRSIKPHVMIVTEVEANINSPVFVNRFSEALFFFSAYFDYVEYFLKNDHADREFVESKLFSPSIRNIVAAEDEERKFRFVGLNVWRAFFARFGMVETELSKLALNHANLVLNMFDCRDSCTLGLNGKSLTVGWKDTPIFSLSAWKFHGMGSI